MKNLKLLSWEERCLVISKKFELIGHCILHQLSWAVKNLILHYFMGIPINYYTLHLLPSLLFQLDSQLHSKLLYTNKYAFNVCITTLLH